MQREQFSAYYYSFTATGNPGVDAVLRAVAKAGKAYHHTERWADDYDEDGPTQADLIQAAADKAASDAEAAIAAAEQRVRDEEFRAATQAANGVIPAAYRQGLEQGRRQGQRDMLARCIAAVEASRRHYVLQGRATTGHDNCLAALRGLGGSDA
jgi:flagellar biosynthesis/type III secretory pathway protein FliH